jgi:hypothetical protein
MKLNYLIGILVEDKQDKADKARDQFNYFRAKVDNQIWQNTERLVEMNHVISFYLKAIK